MITQFKLITQELNELRKGVVKDLIKNGIRSEIDEAFNKDVKDIIKERVENAMTQQNITTYIKSAIRDIIDTLPETDNLRKKIKQVVAQDILDRVDVEKISNRVADNVEYKVVDEVKSVLKRYEMIKEL